MRHRAARLSGSGAQQRRIASGSLPEHIDQLCNAVMRQAQTIESLQIAFVAMLAARLGIAPDDIDVGERFSRYGLDSARAAELIAALATELGRPLSPTLLWDFPTPAALARHLAGVAHDERSLDTPQLPAERHAGPIAIIG